MKKKVSVLLLVMLLIFIGLGSLALVSADESPATVPFKATYQTFPMAIGVLDGHMILKIPAVGHGTYLGKSEWYADSLSDTVDFTSPTQTGSMIFVANNGDKLFGHFEGDGMPNDSGGYDYWGEYTITGGSGKFKGVTGSGTYTGGAGAVTGTAIFEGTLTYP